MFTTPQRTVLSCAVAAAVLSTLGAAYATDVTWNGLNSVSVGSGGTLSTNPDDPANWLPNQVPTTGDRAIIKFNDFHSFTPSPPASNIVVTAADTLFIPDAITYTMNSNTDGVSAWIINKSMTLTDLTFLSPTTNTMGDMIQRFRFATTANVTLTLTGTTPMDFSQANWQILNLGWVGNGPTYQNDPAAKAPTGFRTVVNLTNAAITFAQPLQTAHVANDFLTVTSAGIAGGSAQENTSNTDNSSINFTAVGGTVDIASTGARNSGTLSLGYAQLNIRSDQTWTSSTTGLVRMHHKSAATGFSAAPFMVGSITGARLDNLGQVHFYVDMMNDDFGEGDNTNGRAMRIAGGTYGSIQVNTFPSGSNHTWMMLDNNVTLASTGVQTGTYTGNGGNVNATTTAFGLTLAAGGPASDGNESSIFLNGKTLTIVQGVSLVGTANAHFDSGKSGSSNEVESMKIDATGSTLTIGGDLMIRSTNQSAASSNVDNTGSGSYATRRIGVYGNASTIVNIGGNFSTNTASLSSFDDPVGPPPVPLQALANGLSQATVNLNGGATLHTFEVGDASTKVDLNSDVAVPASQSRITGGFSIGTLNVGDGVTGGNIQLVNNFLNDNAIITPSGATSAGEKLIAGNLNVNTASSLDLNGLTAIVTNNATVNGTGNLKLGGGTLQGTLTLNAGKLTGFGTVTGLVTAGAAAHTIAPSDGQPAATTGTMNLGGLTTNANTTLSFKLISRGTYDLTIPATPVLTVPSVNDHLNITPASSLTLGGGTLAIVNDPANVGAGSLGFYRAIQYNGTFTGVYNSTSILIPAVNPANKITYTLDIARDPGFIDIHRGFQGDANDDGTVTFSDFVKLSNNFGLTDKGWAGGDFNGDGVTTFADFVLLSNNFGLTVGGSSLLSSDEIASFHAATANFGASGVPEPTSLALLGLGAAALLARRRRNR